MKMMQRLILLTVGEYARNDLKSHEAFWIVAMESIQLVGKM
jgi:hypothetical protein